MVIYIYITEKAIVASWGKCHKEGMKLLNQNWLLSFIQWATIDIGRQFADMFFYADKIHIFR